MKTSKKSGTAAVLGLGIMLVLLTLTLGVTGLTIGAMTRAQRDTNSSLAYQAAQAGVEEELTRAHQQLMASEANYSGGGSTGGGGGGGDIGLFGTSPALGVTQSSSPRGAFIASRRSTSTELSSLAPNCVAVATISPNTDPTMAWVTSTVNYRGINKSVRVFIASRDVSVWNNAIFAGTGAVGRAINGNVDIRGSVHILGEGELYSDLNANGVWDPAEAFSDLNNNKVWDPGEPFTDTNGDGIWSAAEPYNDTNGNNIYDPPLTQTDMNSSFEGNAYIGNNYSGMPLDLESRVPPPPRVSNIETLSTEVRVKHGRISIGGNATIGTTSVVDGGTSKSLIDGSYVSDGYTGNKGASAVFSENGTTNSYDLGGLGLKYPTISGIGADPYVAYGKTYTDMAEFYDDYALQCPITTITKSTPAFSFSDSKGNSISFTPEQTVNGVVQPAHLRVNGVVQFDNDNRLQIGSKDKIFYSGSGTLYTTRSINVDGDFLPYPGLTFPTDARVGLVTKRNMYLACGDGSAQLKMAGAFYAQGQLISRKQNQIAGTFVANFYDLGTNVPNIYQVPSLVQNMPPHLPGDKNYYTIRLRSWRDRYLAPGNPVEIAN